MLEYIRGSIDQLTPTQAVIEAFGVGYLINISVNTYSKLQPLKEAKLLVHEVIREDTHDLFGFYDESERQLFRLLIGVNGVGANTARVILSSFTATQLQQCILADDAAKLKSVKGIGLKTAQRVIIDLKDKISVLPEAQNSLPNLPSTSSEILDEALAALLMLGFNKQASQKVLDKIFTANPATTTEAAIKRALTML